MPPEHALSNCSCRNMFQDTAAISLLLQEQLVSMLAPWKIKWDSNTLEMFCLAT